MHHIANNGKVYMLRVDMRLFIGEYGCVEYSTFVIYSGYTDNNISMCV